MADAILYSSLDPDGPGPRLGVTSTSVNGVVGLYNLLMACLVNGYGAGENAKPGQGWELAYAELPNGFTLKAPDNVYYTFCLGPGQTYSYSPPCQVYMSEGVSVLEALPPQGMNVRSGDWHSGSGATHRQWIAAVPHYSYNSSVTWFLIARESQVFFSLVNAPPGDANGLNPSTDSSTTPGMGSMFYLGNVVLKGQNRPSSGAQNSIVLSGLANNHTYSQHTWNPSSEYPNTFLGGGHMALRDLITGAVVVGGGTRLRARPNIMSGRTTYKLSIDTYPPDLMIERVPLWLDGCIGYMPGQFYSTYYSHCRLAEILPVFGRGVGYDSCLQPIDIGGESFYIIPTEYGCLFISLLEKYWNA